MIFSIFFFIISLPNSLYARNRNRNRNPPSSSVKYQGTKEVTRVDSSSRPFLLLVSLEGDFFALDHQNEGSLLWKSTAFSPIFSQPHSSKEKSERIPGADDDADDGEDPNAPFGETIKIALEPSGPGYIYSFDDGERLILPWKQTLAELVYLSPVALGEDRIIVGSKQTFMIYLNAETGEISLSQEGSIVECLAPNPKVVILGKTVYNVKIVNQKTGSVYWNVSYTEYKSPYLDLEPPQAFKEWLFIGSDQDIVVYKDGLITWSISFQTPMAALFYIDESLKAHAIDISMKSSNLASPRKRKVSIQREFGSFLISRGLWNYKDYSPAIHLESNSNGGDLLEHGALMAWNWMSAADSEDDDGGFGFGLGAAGINNGQVDGDNPRLLLLPPAFVATDPATSSYPMLDPSEAASERHFWHRKSFLIPSTLAVGLLIILFIVIRAGGGMANLFKRTGTVGGGGGGGKRKKKNRANTNSQNNENEMEKLKKIEVSDEIIGFGSHGTVVYKGRFEERDVAVKRMLLDFYDLADLEVSMLLQSDDHPNVIRYFCQEKSHRFLYIALELCVATLADCVEKPNLWEQLHLKEKTVIRELCQGIAHLHAINIIHRDIKPQNVLISSKGRVMVSDFGLSKRLDAGVSSFQTVGISGTHGWRAPEIVLLCLSTEPASPTSASSLLRMTRAVDSFALGCVVYYIMTRGLHPFGDILSREMNIANDCTAMERSIEPECLDLVSKLIAFKPENRLDLLKTLQHVYFWTSQDCLYFLQELSDKLDALGPEDATVQSFEKIAHVILKRDWDLIIERGILEETFKYRKYDTSSLKDLLRVIRNKKHHYLDLPEQQRKVLGSLPDGFCSYFKSKFPRLIIESFNFAINDPVLSELHFIKTLLKQYGRDDSGIPSPIEQPRNYSARRW